MSPRLHDIASVLADHADGLPDTEAIALLRARLGHPVSAHAWADAFAAYRDRQLLNAGLADPRHITGRMTCPLPDYDAEARARVDAALDDAVQAMVREVAA